MLSFDLIDWIIYMIFKLLSWRNDFKFLSCLICRRWRVVHLHRHQFPWNWQLQLRNCSHRWASVKWPFGNKNKTTSSTLDHRVFFNLCLDQMVFNCFWFKWLFLLLRFQPYWWRADNSTEFIEDDACLFIKMGWCSANSINSVHNYKFNY